MSVTIDELSRHLGISVSTVSKALNGYTDVSSKTRDRVIALADELGYHPSSAARSLRRGRTEKIGLLINNPISFVSEYVSEIIAGAALTAEAHGNNLVLYTTANTSPQDLHRICRAREVDGLMLIFAPSPEAIAVLKKEKMPYIVFGRRVEQQDVPYVAPDNEGGAYALTEHLIAQGHRRIGFTTRPALGTVSVDRFNGYRRALAGAGIPFIPELVVETAIEPKSGYRALHQLMEVQPRPTAVFVFYDLMAVDALDAAHDRGLGIPRDLAIAGFDGLRSSMITKPRLTTVQQPLQQMGQRGMEILLDRIENGELSIPREIFPVELKIRQSTRQ